MQVRFQKRMNHYFSFEGNYTYAKAEDDSSIGFNAFVGNLNTVFGYTVGNPQQLDRLKPEWGVSANDATHRFVLAAIGELPIGRGRAIGSDMNRVLDGFIGGWQISTLITLHFLAASATTRRQQPGNRFSMHRVSPIRVTRCPETRLGISRSCAPTGSTTWTCPLRRSSPSMKP